MKLVLRLIIIGKLFIHYLYRPLRKRKPGDVSEPYRRKGLFTNLLQRLCSAFLIESI